MSHTGPESGYVEATPFAQVLLSTLNVELIDIFLRKHNHELTPTDLSEFTEAPPDVVSNHLSTLSEEQIIKEVESASTELETAYTLNDNSKIVSGLQQAQQAML